MNPADYPTANEADICLILEGTYPFVRGGVSHWVHELIRVFAHYRFAVIFLGTRAEDYPELCYPLAANVVHLEAHYLFEQTSAPHQSSENISSVSMEKVTHMHDDFRHFVSEKSCPMGELFELMGMLSEGQHLNEELFFRSHSAWQFIVSQYEQHHANQSFFDYFWGVRNLHRPLWVLAKIVNHIPKVKVLHSASTGYAGFLGALLQKKYSLPYVLTEHGIYTKERWIDLMRNYFFQHVLKDQRLQIQENGLLSIWVRFFSILAKVAYDAANPIISLFDEYQQRQINDGAMPEKTRIISYGIDFERYAFMGKEKPNPIAPVIACIGRVVPIKDVKTFIRASALVLKHIPAAQAWIVGSVDEDPDYVSECQRLVQMLGLEEKILFLGEKNVMEIYPLIDLLVLCSISEGSPFVILESMAVGIPVVATHVGGCKELIEGKQEDDRALGLAGALVNMADPDSLAQASIALLTDAQRWRHAQQVGVLRLHTHYSMQKFMETYDMIYQEAMQ